MILDINECVAQNGGCEGVCANVPGSYYCRCPPGYRLSADGKSCVGKSTAVNVVVEYN